jgi:hypothetical protein
MKNLILILGCLILFAIPAFGQANDEKREVLDARDQAKTLEWRNRTGNWKNSGGEIYFYPSMYIYWGKGFSEGLGKITVDGKAGFIDSRGRIVIKPTFKDTGGFFNGLAPFEDYNGKWGFIDKKGTVVVEPVYDWAFGFYSGGDLARVQLGGKWGYINAKGEQVIKPQFNDAGGFREGLACVEIGKKYGFIDLRGNSVIEPQFDSPSMFFEGLAAVMIDIPAPLPGFTAQKDHKWGFIDKTGNWIIPPTWDGGLSFYAGMARVWKHLGHSKENREGFLIDKTGKVVWDENSFTIRSYSADTMVVRMEGADGLNLADRNGKRITERMFDDIGFFSEGLSAAASGEKYGFIDRNGEFVISPRFDFALYFKDGLALVRDGKKYGFINASGEYAIRAKFDYAWPFGGDAALVVEGEKTGYIDKTGRYIWKPTR